MEEEGLDVSGVHRILGPVNDHHASVSRFMLICKDVEAVLQIGYAKRLLTIDGEGVV